MAVAGYLFPAAVGAEAFASSSTLKVAAAAAGGFTAGAFNGAVNAAANGGNIWQAALFGGLIAAVTAGLLQEAIELDALNNPDLFAGRGAAAPEMGIVEDPYVSGIFKKVFDTMGKLFKGVSSFFDDIIGPEGATVPDEISIPEKVMKVLKTIQKTGETLPGYESHDFGNREGFLPKEGKYKGYDVDPKPPAGTRRTAERLVVDQKTGRAWWVPKHWETPPNKGNYYPIKSTFPPIK